MNECTIGFSGIIFAMIVMETSLNGIQREAALETILMEKEQEEAGWKLVHEDAFRPQIMQTYDQQRVLPSILEAEHAYLHGNNQHDIDRRQSIPTFQNYRQQVCK